MHSTVPLCQGPVSPQGHACHCACFPVPLYLCPSSLTCWTACMAHGTALHPTAALAVGTCRQELSVLQQAGEHFPGAHKPAVTLNTSSPIAGGEGAVSF